MQVISISQEFGASLVFFFFFSNSTVFDFLADTCCCINLIFNWTYKQICRVSCSRNCSLETPEFIKKSPAPLIIINLTATTVWLTMRWKYDAIVHSQQPSKAFYSHLTIYVAAVSTVKKDFNTWGGNMFTPEEVSQFFLETTWSNVTSYWQQQTFPLSRLHRKHARNTPTVRRGQTGQSEMNIVSVP